MELKQLLVFKYLAYTLILNQYKLIPMKIYVLPEAIPLATELESIKDVLNNTLLQVKKFKISLSKKERGEGRKMGPRRLAYSQSAVRHGKQQIDEMPRSFEPANFEKLMQYYQDLAGIRVIVSQLSEFLNDTDMAIRIDAMTHTKTVHDAIKSSNNSNPALDAALDELDEFNKRAQQEDTETPEDTPPTDTPTE